MPAWPLRDASGLVGAEGEKAGGVGGDKADEAFYTFRATLKVWLFLTQVRLALAVGKLRGRWRHRWSDVFMPPRVFEIV
jgi:hypothetical protein